MSVAEARHWGRQDVPDAARERLLDAAGRVFAARGVAGARMSEVASAAGCSRGTLYRYFPDAAALRLGFVEREARRLGDRLAAALAGVDEPKALLVEGCLAAVAEVRADPLLAAWFDPTASGLAGETAGQAVTIERLVDGFLSSLFGGAASAPALRPGLDRGLAADWLVRVLLSLLAQPGRPRGRHRSVASAERALLEQCLVPAFFS